jgi:hypothetical protein
MVLFGENCLIKTYGVKYFFQTDTKKAARERETIDMDLRQWVAMDSLKYH